jgi:predicted thioredoxin/glutaredoxin
MEDVEDIKELKAVVSVTFTKAIDRRQQIERQLRTLLASNAESLKMLRSLTEMKQLSTSKTGTGSVKKKLEEALKEAKKEVEDADRIWNGLAGTLQQLDKVCVINIFN